MERKAVRRLGLGMREAIDPFTRETRDALARDWPRFLEIAFPEISWCPIPNIGNRVVGYIERWQLDAICLTGGDDIGEHTARDETERALLAHCFANGMPTLGVCRGAQRIWTALGGALKAIDGHAGTSHKVTLNAEIARTSASTAVNSFHHFGLDASSVPESLTCIACAEDGSIEAVLGEQPRVLGLMWHPERMPTPEAIDVQLIRWLFGHD